MQVQEAQEHATKFVQKVMAMEMPTQADYVEYLSGLGLFESIIILACGLVYLLQGWKIFKILVIVNAALLGSFLPAWSARSVKAAEVFSKVA